MIMVHDVLEDSEAGRLGTSTSITFQSFQSNVLGLTRRFSFVSLDEAVDMLTGQKSWRGNCVVLTFDDSLKCMADVVAPHLRQWGIPATFYLSTDAIERQQPYWWHRLDFALKHAHGKRLTIDMSGGQSLVVELCPDSPSMRALAQFLRESSARACEETVASLESKLGTRLADAPPAACMGRLLDWDDVRALSRQGMTIGCHTRSHPNLTIESPESLSNELSSASELISANAQAACQHFCYPYGAYSQDVRAAVKNAGFRSAVTTIRPGWNRPGDDLFQLKRFHMHAEPHCLPCLMSPLGQLLTRARN